MIYKFTKVDAFTDPPNNGDMRHYVVGFWVFSSTSWRQVSCFHSARTGFHLGSQYWFPFGITVLVSIWDQRTSRKAFSSKICYGVLKFTIFNFLVLASVLFFSLFFLFIIVLLNASSESLTKTDPSLSAMAV